jgi:hypothetical protein
LGSRDVIGDQVGNAAGMIRIRAHRRGKDRRGEDADAIGAEVLQEPRNRCEDCRASVGLIEQCSETLLGMSVASGLACRKLDVARILRFAHQQFLHRLLSLVDLPSC